MNKVYKLLIKLSNIIQDKELSHDIVKLSKNLKNRKFLILDKDELESLVNSEKVKYENYIGNVSIDKL